MVSAYEKYLPDSGVIYGIEEREANRRVRKTQPRELDCSGR
jgi:hypothetical protein